MLCCCCCCRCSLFDCAHDYITLQRTQQQIKVQQNAIFMKVNYSLGKAFHFSFSSRESGTSIWKTRFFPIRRADKEVSGCQTGKQNVMQRSWRTESTSLSPALHSVGNVHVLSLKMLIYKHFANSTLVVAPEAETVNKPQEAIPLLCIALSLRIFFNWFCRLLTSNENWIYFELMEILQALIPRFPYSWAATRVHICQPAMQSSSVWSYYLVHAAANFSIEFPF